MLFAATSSFGAFLALSWLAITIFSNLQALETGFIEFLFIGRIPGTSTQITFALFFFLFVFATWSIIAYKLFLAARKTSLTLEETQPFSIPSVQDLGNSLNQLRASCTALYEKTHGALSSTNVFRRKIFISAKATAETADLQSVEDVAL